MATNLKLDEFVCVVIQLQSICRHTDRTLCSAAAASSPFVGDPPAAITGSRHKPALLGRCGPLPRLVKVPPRRKQNKAESRAMLPKARQKLPIDICRRQLDLLRRRPLVLPSIEPFLCATPPPRSQASEHLASVPLIRPARSAIASRPKRKRAE
jgi:hypothetical protein